MRTQSEQADQRLASPCCFPATTRKRRSLQTVAGFRAALPGADIYVYDNNSTRPDPRGGGGRPARSSGTERMQGKGHVVRRMFADIEADIYVMADGDATYDAGRRARSGPQAARRAARHGGRRPQVGGGGGLSPRPPCSATGCSPGFSPACSAAASATSSRATGSFRAASSRASRRCRAASRPRPRSASMRSSCAMPVGEVDDRLWRASRRLGIEALHLSRRLADHAHDPPPVPDRAAGALLRRLQRCS